LSPETAVRQAPFKNCGTIRTNTERFLLHLNPFDIFLPAMPSAKPHCHSLSAAPLFQAHFAYQQPAMAAAKIALPLFTGKVAAGFPSPADDYVEKSLDLNELLVQKPAATFFVRAQGESMLGAGIHPNDILVVDRSIEPIAGKIVICALNSELTVKRLTRDNQQWRLKAENPAYPDIIIHDELDMVIWGVVTNVIHAV
jgi:DNA polymerase V